MNEENQKEQNKSEETIKFHCNKCGGKAYESHRHKHHKSRKGCNGELTLCTGRDCLTCTPIMPSKSLVPFV